jgi:hypothetical protein
MVEPILIKFGMYIMAHDFILTRDYINTSTSLCLYIYIYIYICFVDRQRLDKYVTAAKSTDLTTEELFNTSLSVWSLYYQEK